VLAGFYGTARDELVLRGEFFLGSAAQSAPPLVFAHVSGVHHYGVLRGNQRRRCAGAVAAVALTQFGCNRFGRRAFYLMLIEPSLLADYRDRRRGKSSDRHRETLWCRCRGLPSLHSAEFPFRVGERPSIRGLWMDGDLRGRLRHVALADADEISRPSSNTRLPVTLFHVGRQWFRVRVRYLWSHIVCSFPLFVRPQPFSSSPCTGFQPVTPHGIRYYNSGYLALFPPPTGVL